MPDPFAIVYGQVWFVDTDAGLVFTDKGVFPLVVGRPQRVTSDDIEVVVFDSTIDHRVTSDDIEVVVFDSTIDHRVTSGDIEVVVTVPFAGTVDIDTLAETDSLIPIPEATPQTIAVGTLAETNSLLAIPPTKLASVGTLAEANALISVAGIKTADVGTLAEIDNLIAIAPSVRLGIGTLAQIDNLIAVTQPVAPQILVPVADIDAGSWTVEPLWSKVNDDSTVFPTGDGTTISSAAVGNNTNTTDADLEGPTSGITDPAVSTGHIIRVRWNSSSARDIIGHAELWQGVPDVGSLIAEATVTLTDATEVETTYSLNTTETDNITNYNDLHFTLWGRGTGGGPDRALVVDLLELEIPGVAAGNTVAVGTLTETDSLLTISGLKTADVGTLAEVDALVAIAFGRGYTVGTLAEVEALVAVQARKIANIGTLAETDSLLPVGVSIFKTIGTLAEIDSLLPIAVQQAATPIGTMAEVNALLAIGGIKTIDVGTLAEINTLLSIAGLTAIDVGTLAEIDSLLEIAFGLVIISFVTLSGTGDITAITSSGTANILKEIGQTGRIRRPGIRTIKT